MNKLTTTPVLTHTFLSNSNAVHAFASAKGLSAVAVSSLSNVSANRPLCASEALRNAEEPLSLFEQPVMDIGKQLASVSKDNLPFDQSSTRL